MTEEDEAFNEIERQAKQRKESVRAAINKDKPMNNQLAFPNPNRTDQTGMTLRDYFAAKAMQAIMGDRKEQNYWAEDYSIDEMMQFTAERAYEQADAMLKAREKS
jgi:hypothetical protein